MSTTLKRAFVLIGTQGSGKSATGNSIIEKKCFASMSGTQALTKEIKEQTWQWQKREITIIDTPSVNGLPEFSEIKNHAEAKYTDIKYGFVISIGRPLANETNVLGIIYELINPKTDLVLIFTRYDELDQDNSFESWLSDCPSLKAFIEKTAVKYFHFANKNGSTLIKDQVSGLMSTIMGITKEVKHETHVNMSTKADSIKEGKRVEVLTADISQPEKDEEFPVNCELLKEHFGKSGVSFYNNVLKKGQND